MDAIPFERVADYPLCSEDFSLVTQSVADDGCLLFLFVEAGGTEAVRGMDSRGGARFARTRMDPPMRFRLLRVEKGGCFVTDLPPLDITFPLIDVFPDGKVLVAGARCAWYEEGEFDLNGVLYDPVTGGCTRILLGDGIVQLHVDRRGLIWVSYFDEGIFGNFGWGNPGPLPIGAAGLACFSESGEKVWEFEGKIEDCYALNVSGSEAFAYYYTEFPICRLSGDFRVTSWRTELRGCRHLAVSGSKVLLSGQYDDPPGTGYLGVLDGDALKDVQPVRLVLPNTSPLPTHRLLGRGQHLHYFGDDAIYRTTVK